MQLNRRCWFSSVIGASLYLLSGCSTPQPPATPSSSPQAGLEVKVLVGSALGDFCSQAAGRFNQAQPHLDNGTPFFITCGAAGSGDVVELVLTLAQRYQQGSLAANAPEWPTLLSVDGEIYHSQLIYHMNQLFPSQNYIPAIADAPLLANSPMVFMTTAELAPGLRNIKDLFPALVTAKTHKDLDASSPAQAIQYVHTAPTRSNSGLQTLVAQFASVSGKRPEQMTLANVNKAQTQVQAIQQKITRYGISTDSLAKDMVKNGPFWASIASVYESSVIIANSNLQPGQPPFQAVYPKFTFSSNMRAILATAPWVSADERAAALQFTEFLRSPQTQALATDLGLRPGTPGVRRGAKFSLDFGVDPDAVYQTYLPPQPEVVAAMLNAWEVVAKKPSLVVVVVDSSGSMLGNKLPAVQQTLKTYVDQLRPLDQVALIDFDSRIRPPILVDGTSSGRDRSLQFINSLNAEGGTKLYDSVLEARNWLLQHLRANAINAVLVLTDGEDSGSRTSLSQLQQALAQSGFKSDKRIAIFSVGYGNDGEFNPDVLRAIADQNGGYYSKGDPDTIAKVMDKLQLEF